MDAVTEEIKRLASGLPEGSEFGFFVDGSTVVLEMLNLPEEARGRGIGSALIAAVTELADARGMDCLLVADPVDEPGAPGSHDLYRLYSRFGFVPTAYAEADGLSMRREAGAGPAEPVPFGEFPALIESLSFGSGPKPL